MTRVCDIYENLCELAPVETQMSFDNAGFLLGHSEEEVKNVLLALDITDAVIDEAMETGAELIVSHHPLIFGALKSLTDIGPGRKALRMAENHIAAICMHTNLDIAQGGVNDVLIKLLGAEALEALDEENCGRIGELSKPVALEEFLEKSKYCLNAKGIRYYNAGKPVKRFAVMGGSGADDIATAYSKGCDTYLTADIKYHQFQTAQELGINLIDADHFSTENPIIPVLAARLASAFPDVSFHVSQKHEALIDFI